MTWKQTLDSHARRDGAIASHRDMTSACGKVAVQLAIPSKPLRNSRFKQLARDGMMAREGQHGGQIMLKLRFSAIAGLARGHLRQVRPPILWEELSRKYMVAGLGDRGHSAIGASFSFKALAHQFLFLPA